MNKQNTSLMKYKYSAFIETTPEMREWLESIGYKEIDIITCPCQYLMATKEGYYMQSMILPTYAENNFIDCRSNPSLFKAVTAITDDSDYMQWFTDGATWLIFDGRTKYFEKYFHKATREELEVKFKK